MHVQSIFGGPPNLQITKEIDKIAFQKKVQKKNSSLTEQKKTFDRSDHTLKRNMKFSNQKKSTKSRSMLPFQEGMGEMSHEQQNLILTSVQFLSVAL